MMTVRFPTGISVRFNDANYCIRSGTGKYADLYTTKDGAWIAQVPSSCVIEIRQPCRVWNAITEPSEAIESLIKLIDARDRSLKNYELADLKRALEAFDARRKGWK